MFMRQPRSLLLRRSSSGFTLIELLIVIIIIGLLVAIAVPAFLKYRAGAHDTDAKATLTTAFKEAKAAAADDGGVYPPEATLVAELAAAGSGMTFVAGDESAANTDGKVAVERVSGTSVKLHTLSGSGDVMTLTEDPTTRQYAFSASEAAPATLSYADTVLADNPVAYWRLGDAGAVDATGNGRTPTYENGPAPTTGAVSDGDSALTFAASSSQYATIANAAVFQSASFTVEAWVKVANNGGAILANSNNGTATGWELVAGSELDPDTFLPTGNMLIQLRDASNGTAVNSSAFAPNTWVHVAVSVGGGTMTMYLNGVESGSRAGSPVGTSGVPLLIGAYSGPVFDPASFYFFDGAIDELAFYDRALSAADAQAHYEAR